MLTRASNDSKIKMAPSVDKGHILVRILLTGLHLQRNKKTEGHLSGMIR